MALEGSRPLFAEVGEPVPPQGSPAVRGGGRLKTQPTNRVLDTADVPQAPQRHTIMDLVTGCIFFQPEENFHKPSADTLIY